MRDSQRGPERWSVYRTSLSCAWLEAAHKQIYDQGGSPLLRSSGDLASLYTWSIVSGSGVQLRCSMILEKASIRKFRESWTILNTERASTYIHTRGQSRESWTIQNTEKASIRESSGINGNQGQSPNLYMRLRRPQTISDRGTYAVVCCCLKHCLMPSGIWWLVFGIYIHT